MVDIPSVELSDNLKPDYRAYVNDINEVITQLNNLMWGQVSQLDATWKKLHISYTAKHDSDDDGIHFKKSNSAATDIVSLIKQALEEK